MADRNASASSSESKGWASACLWFAPVRCCALCAPCPAGPACLAWFGNKEDGKCLSYSNGAPTNIGTPAFGYGPSGGGVYTGPLLPGTTINQGIG